MEVHPTLFSCCFTSSLGMLCINACDSLKFWSLCNLQFCLIFSYIYTYSILHFVDLNTRVRSSQIYFFRNNLLSIFIKLWRNIYCDEFCMYILLKMIAGCTYCLCCLLFQPLTIYWAIRLATLKSLIPAIGKELRIHYLGMLSSSHLCVVVFQNLVCFLVKIFIIPQIHDMCYVCNRGYLSPIATFYWGT